MGYDEVQTNGKVGGQHKDELDQFVTLLKRLAPRSYLEVGARHGRMVRYLVARVPSIERISVVDLPGARWGRENSALELVDNLNATGKPWVFHNGNSTDPEIIQQVAARRYDVIFIDADHTYEGVLQDWSNYGPLADMAVGFHDINHPPDTSCYGPSKLWNETREGKHTVEFIQPGSTTGIGVIIL